MPRCGPRICTNFVHYLYLRRHVYQAQHSLQDHRKHLSRVCNIVNLDVGFVSPSCLLPSGDWRWSESYGFYILLAVPLIQFFVTGCAYLMVSAWGNYVNDPDDRNADSRPGPVEGDSPGLHVQHQESSSVLYPQLPQRFDSICWSRI